MQTDYISSIIEQVEKYYGIELLEDHKDSIIEIIHNSIVHQAEDIPNEYNIMYNGKIVQGAIKNLPINDLIYFREQDKKSEFALEDWKNCLLPVSNQLAYCEENGIIYYDIDKTIIKYLNKHKCSSLIYRILINEAWIPEVKGETVKIYDTFIRKERDIKIKKDMLLDDSFDKDDEFVVLKYLRVKQYGKSSK